MKKLSISLIFILSFVFSFAQPKVQRSTGSNTAVDQRVAAGLNLYVPTYADTTAANLTTPNNIGIDSCGAQIYTYDVQSYWFRQCPYKKWVQIAGGSSFNQTCGNPSGYHVVTWDSLLVFDVSAGPYVLCCDNIQRSTAFDSILLQPSDPTNPRYDAIILDATGVTYIKGVASANPKLPQLTDCQILLTYVLINAGDLVPADVVQSVIYDQNYHPSEWYLTASGITADTTNTVFPAHLTKSINVGTVSLNTTLTFHDSLGTVSLNDYGVLKFYIRLKAGAAATTPRFFFTFLLDGVQQTQAVLLSDGIYGFNKANSTSYQIISIPISKFNILTSDVVNELQITLQGSYAGFYLDWVQLQAGLIQSGTQGLQTFGSGNLSPLFTTTVANANTFPFQTFDQVNATAYGVFRNSSNVAAFPSFGAINLATPMITGLLPVANIAAGNANDVLTTIGGVAAWAPSTPGYDTTFAINWITAFPGVTKDTIGWGGRTLGSALLRYDTHLGLSTYNIKIEQGSDIVFLIDPIGYSSYLRATNGTNSEAVLGAEGDFGNGKVFFNLRSVHSTDTVNVRGDAISKKLTVTVDSILFKSTLGPAVTGYVWTLKDAATGSGYWAVSGAGSGVPINTLLAATGTNTINNANFGQEWQWNTLAATTALGLTSTSTAATGNSQVLFSSSLSGANATAGQITKAAYIINSHTGATSQNYAGDFRATNGTTNVAGYFSASAGTNNYAIIVPTSGGRVGIGNSAPDSLLHLTGGLHTVSGGVRFESLPAGGVAADSVLVVTSTGIVKKRDAASFGSVGNTIYTGDGTLAGNRILDFGGNTLSFAALTTFNINNGGFKFFNLDYGNGLFQIGDMDGYDAGANIKIDNNAGGIITYTAALAHIFTGNVGIGVTPSADQLFVVKNINNELFYINKTIFDTYLSAGDDIAATAGIEFFGDSGGGNVTFELFANGGNLVEILGDAIAQTITLTADTLLFNSNLAGKTDGMAWVLQDNTTGSGYWGYPSIPINKLLGATNFNFIDNGFFGQDWSWTNLGGACALCMGANTTQASGNTQALLQLSLGGTNSNSNQSTRTLFVSNNHDGTGAVNYSADFDSYGSGAVTNIGASFRAAGGTNNYAIIVPTGEGNVGIGTATPSSAALLELASTTQALIIMRMTATQGSAITPAAGMIIFVTNTNGTFTSAGFWGYDGSAWAKF